jgi:hypothetical protein
MLMERNSLADSRHLSVAMGIERYLYRQMYLCVGSEPIFIRKGYS